MLSFSLNADILILLLDTISSNIFITFGVVQGEHPLADKYEYEYWSIFVFIFKDFGLNLIIFMFIDWLCLNMNIFTSGRGSKSIIYQLQFNQSFMY